tara:strand:- start:1793 stop:1993 length:201 start_codon:yes stop_codon:yes gene_type:complete
VYEHYPKAVTTQRGFVRVESNGVPCISQFQGENKDGHVYHGEKRDGTNGVGWVDSHQKQYGWNIGV